MKKNNISEKEIVSMKMNVINVANLLKKQTGRKRFKKVIN
jgi:hypothetical protein